MAIPIFNFVGITSGVVGANQVPTRNYGALVITRNTRCSSGTILTFLSAIDVGDWFGVSSEEYARAVFYFGWVSKNITKPQLLSFWFWNDDAATADYIFGVPPISTLTQFNAMTGGASAQLELTMGGFTHTVTADLAGAGSLAAVATDLTTAVNAYMAGGAAWTGAVISYDATDGAFDLVSGVAAADATFAVTAAASHDVAAGLGWLNSETIINKGTAAQLLAANLAQLTNISNNFGSITTTFDLALTLSNTEVLANFVNTVTPNVQFINSVNVSAANASAWEAALANIGGTTLTLQSPAPVAATEFPEMAPMMIFAATNYNAPNSVQNYKYQEFNLTPSVTDQTDYNTYTGLNINFYGNTQTAGQIIDFYMDGVMFGLATDPAFQNLYANEIWFKDNLGAALLNLQLALSEIPANPKGLGLMRGAMQPIIDLALNNGTISVGKELTSDQKAAVAQISGSTNAWYQVQNQGYWINIVIQVTVVNSKNVYTGVYTLIYSKDDTIQAITGSNVLV